MQLLKFYFRVSCNIFSRSSALLPVHRWLWIHVVYTAAYCTRPSGRQRNTDTAPSVHLASTGDTCPVQPPEITINNISYKQQWLFIQVVQSIAQTYTIIHLDAVGPYLSFTSYHIMSPPISLPLKMAASSVTFC